MIPDDDSLRSAMHRIEPAGADASDLFDRVAAGARGRRRRVVSVVSAAAVVVAIASLVPAIGHGGSSPRVHPLGTPASPNPLLLLPESPTASPPAVASPPTVLESPTPPLSSTPPTPPLITTGACAGLRVAMSYDQPPRPPGVLDGAVLVGSDLAAEPSLNLVTVRAGSAVSFYASGPVACVNRLVLTAVAGTFPWSSGSAPPGQNFVPLIIRPDGPGVEDVEVQLKGCDAAGTCDQLLAEANISVDPPASSTANPVSTNLSECPTVLPLAPGADAEAQAKAAAVKLVPTIYPPETTKDFTVTSVYPASLSIDSDKGYGAIAYGMCGKTIGDRTLVVEVNFPHIDSASVGNGQLFVSEFSTGWMAWYRYH